MEALPLESASASTIKIENRVDEITDDKQWIGVSIERIRGSDGHPHYKVCFQTSAGIEWKVNHRFRVFRQLMWDLQEINGASFAPKFPPTFIKSKFGIGLTREQLDSRTSLLLQVEKG